MALYWGKIGVISIRSSSRSVSWASWVILENRSMSPLGSMATTEYPLQISCSMMCSMILVLPTLVVPKHQKWPLRWLSGKPNSMTVWG